MASECLHATVLRDDPERKMLGRFIHPRERVNPHENAVRDFCRLRYRLFGVIVLALFTYIGQVQLDMETRHIVYVLTGFAWTLFATDAYTLVILCRIICRRKRARAQACFEEVAWAILPTAVYTILALGLTLLSLEMTYPGIIWEYWWGLNHWVHGLPARYHVYEGVVMDW